jgi:replication factor C subunit 2/4
MSLSPPTDGPDKENAKRPVLSSASKMPWVEAYRPRTLQDVVGNVDTVLRLRAIAKDGNLPNLIVCGPPGTGKFTNGFSCSTSYIDLTWFGGIGKTTSVHALARELLGPAYKDGVLELNASDARGIDVGPTMTHLYWNRRLIVAAS